MNTPHSKYHARKVEIDGITFASKAEGHRYLELKLMEKVGEIGGLELQPRYPLVVNGVKIGLYKADFLYKDMQTGKIIVEEVKGYKTREYKRTKLLIKAIYGIDIVEVQA